MGLKAPSVPESPRGQQLAYILRTAPEMFESAVDAQLDALGDEIEREVEPEEASDEAKKDQLVLFKRIADVRALERRNGVEDIMYTSIIQKFLGVGVDMLPPLDETTTLRGVDLNRLTDGVHSREALDMVREHLMAVLGGAGENAYSSQLVRMSKLQAAQVYAASIMFGNFLTRADRRFQLDRAAGTLPLDPLESANALERLFNSASAMDSMDEADAAPENFGGADFDLFSDSPSGAASGGSASLKQYIQNFDQSTLAATADRVHGGRASGGASDRGAVWIHRGVAARDAKRRERRRGDARGTHERGERRGGAEEGADVDARVRLAETIGARGCGVRGVFASIGDVHRWI